MSSICNKTFTLIININYELLVKCLIHYNFYTLVTFTSSIYFNPGSYFIVYFTLFNGSLLAEIGLFESPYC